MSLHSPPEQHTQYRCTEDTPTPGHASSAPRLGGGKQRWMWWKKGFMEEQQATTASCFFERHKHTKETLTDPRAHTHTSVNIQALLRLLCRFPGSDLTLEQNNWISIMCVLSFSTHRQSQIRLSYLWLLNQFPENLFTGRVKEHFQTDCTRDCNESSAAGRSELQSLCLEDLWVNVRCFKLWRNLESLVLKRE